MALTPEQVAFIEANRSAAMITYARDGTAKAARVAVGIVDGRLLSSGTLGRIRTRHVRRDPRSTLFVYDSEWLYMSIETTVTIIDSPDVPDLSFRFFRTIQRVPDDTEGVGWQGAHRTEAEFKQAMVDEGRIMYEFEPLHVYGLYQMP